MKHIIYTSTALLILILAFTVSPLGAYAHVMVAPQADVTAPETVSIQVDSVTPSGAHVTGTLVIHRTPGNTQSAVQFDGTMEGQPASVTARATEDWSNGNAKINITKITSWNAPIPQPQLMNIEISQAGTGLLTINGIPMAISAPILPPGSGNASYVVTNAGAGTGAIVSLPRTGEGPASTAIEPLLLVALLVLLVPILVGFGSLLAWLGGTRQNRTIVQGAK